MRHAERCLFTGDRVREKRMSANSGASTDPPSPRPYLVLLEKKTPLLSYLTPSTSQVAKGSPVSGLFLSL